MASHLRNNASVNPPCKTNVKTASSVPSIPQPNARIFSMESRKIPVKKRRRPSMPNDGTHFSNMYTMPIKLYFLYFYTHRQNEREFPQSRCYFPSEIYSIFLYPYRVLHFLYSIYYICKYFIFYIMHVNYTLYLYLQREDILKKVYIDSAALTGRTSLPYRERHKANRKGRSKTFAYRCRDKAEGHESTTTSAKSKGIDLTTRLGTTRVTAGTGRGEQRQLAYYLACLW